MGPAGYFNTARWCSMGVQWGEGRREQSEISTGSDRQSAASRNTNRQLPAHVLEETRREQNLEVSGKLPLGEGPFVVFQKKPSTCRGKSRLMIPGPMGMKAFTSRCLIHRCISRRERGVGDATNKQKMGRLLCTALPFHRVGGWRSARPAGAPAGHQTDVHRDRRRLK